MSAAEEPSADLEHLRGELHAALRAEDDRRAILAACQMLARAEIAPDDRRNVLRIRAAARRRASHFAAAADDLTRLLDQDGAREAVLAERAVCLYEMGEFQAALDDLLAA